MLYCLPSFIRFEGFHPSSLPFISITSHCLCNVHVFALSSVDYLAYTEYLNEKKTQGRVEFTQSYSADSVIFAELTEQLLIVYSINTIPIQNTKEDLFLALESFLLNY